MLADNLLLSTIILAYPPKITKFYESIGMLEIYVVPNLKYFWLKSKGLSKNEKFKGSQTFSSKKYLKILTVVLGLIFVSKIF